MWLHGLYFVWALMSFRDRRTDGRRMTNDSRRKTSRFTQDTHAANHKQPERQLLHAAYL